MVSQVHTATFRIQSICFWPNALFSCIIIIKKIIFLDFDQLSYCLIFFVTFYLQVQIILVVTNWILDRFVYIFKPNKDSNVNFVIYNGKRWLEKRKARKLELIMMDVLF